MPTSPPQPCARCGRRLALRGTSHCTSCTRLSSFRRGYTKEWTACSRDWLRRFPWCGQRRDGALHDQDSRCARRGLKTPARVTDHIVPLRDGGPLTDEGNLQSLCYSCNTAKG